MERATHNDPQPATTIQQQPARRHNEAAMIPQRSTIKNLQLTVILGSLWVVVACCGSLWLIVGRRGLFHVLKYNSLYSSASAVQRFVMGCFGVVVGSVCLVLGRCGSIVVIIYYYYCCLVVSPRGLFLDCCGSLWGRCGRFFEVFC